MSPEFLGAEGSPDVTGTALARMTWDDTNLYLFATVTDPDSVLTMTYDLAKACA